MPRPQLAAMNAFRRVVELHSFHAAARSLGVTGGAVSKLITQLERDLGVRLLHRTTRAVSISPEGARFHEAAVRILDDVDAASESVRSDQASVAGRLRVSTPTSFSLRWLAPRLPAFVREFPALELDLALNDRYVDLVQEGFDCALRIGTDLPDSTLVARRLGTVQRVLVASPAYLAQAPALARPADLTTHACLLYSLPAVPHEWPMRGTPDGRPVRVTGSFRVNNSVMLRELLLAGLGVTLTPDFVVDDLLASGQLVELLPACRPLPQGVHGIVAHPRYVPHKVTKWLDFVARELQLQTSAQAD